MLTELGKFLRKLRIEKNEIIMNMAKKLDIAPSYLSSIECGKRNVPKDFIAKVVAVYELGMEQQRELEHARDMALEEVKINLANASPEKKADAIQFARTFNDFDQDFMRKLSKAIDKIRRDAV